MHDNHPRGGRGLVTAIGLLALTLSLPQWLPAGDETKAVRLVVLDVGEGQSVLVARGQRGVLIDSGRPGKGRYVINRLEAHGVERLESVIYTHLHPDHAGSWFRIEEAFPRVRVVESGHRRSGTNWPDTSRWVANALDRLPDSRHRTVARGDRWTDLGLEFRVLWPAATTSGNLNEQSLVLSIGNGATTALVMGDVGQQTERQLLDAGALPSDIAVLVAGHHGSKRSSSSPLLEHTSPGFAVVSTDSNNIRGYPDAETIGRLQSHAEQLLRTWIDGEVCIELSDLKHARRCPSPG